MGEISFSVDLDLAVVPSSGVRAIVITGAGGVFCSGLNLCRMIPWGSVMAEQEGEIKRTHFAGLVLNSPRFGFLRSQPSTVPPWTPS